MKRERVRDSETLTALLGGVFTGNILLCLQQINKIQSAQNYLVFVQYLNGGIFLLYLVYGYFNLFKIYHKNDLFFLSPDHFKNKNIVKIKNIILALLLITYSTLPFTIGCKKIIFFYLIFTIAATLDMIFIKQYKNSFKEFVRDSRFFKRDICIGFSFDIVAISVSLLLFIMFLNINNLPLFMNPYIDTIIPVLNFLYFAPFAFQLLRYIKDE